MREDRQIQISRLILALVTIAAAVALITASFQTWLSLPDGAGGTTWVSGWGAVSGGADIAGQNLNNALDGQATFRPGLIPLIFGGLTVVPALVLALVGGRERAHRVTAAFTGACGLVALAFGILRLVQPDSAGIVPGEGSAGLGQWLTIGAGVTLIGVATSIFTGVLDEPDLFEHRGIQP